jgi:hypothetical protein
LEHLYQMDANISSVMAAAGKEAAAAAAAAESNATELPA